MKIPDLENVDKSAFLETLEKQGKSELANPNEESNCKNNKKGCTRENNTSKILHIKV